MPMSEFSIGTINLTPQAAFEAPEKKGATAIIAESQRSRLSFLVEASSWACHCDGHCPSAQERC